MTSIEWLRNELVNNENIRWRGTNIDVLIEQAKEMHKTEIIDAYMDRMDCTNKEELAKIIGREYYEKKFKKK
jgi:hypothetical protein